MRINTAPTGRSYTTGVISGRDTQALIENAYNKRAKIYLDRKEELNDEVQKISAIGEFKSYVEKLKDSLEVMRGKSIISGDLNNAFAAKEVLLSASNGVGVENYIGVEVDNNIPNSNFSLKVDRLAKGQKTSSITFSSANTSVVNAAGNVEAGKFNVGGLSIAGVAIDLEEGEKLADVVFKINQKTTQTGVVAKFVTLMENQSYKIILESKNIGASAAFAVTDSSSCISGSFQSAQDSRVYIDGQEIIRSSNSISDYMSGLSINLKQVTPKANGSSISEDVTIDVNVGLQKSEVRKSIQNVLDQYNNLLKFVTKNSVERKAADAKDEDEGKEGYLYRSMAVEKVMQSIDDVLGFGAIGNNLKYNTLEGLGIVAYDQPANPGTNEPQYMGLLKISPSEMVNLDDVLANDFEELAKSLSFSAEADKYDFAIAKHGSMLNKSSFSVTVNVSGGVSNAVSFVVDGQTYVGEFKPNNSGDLTKGGELKGIKGTPLEGVVIYYSGLGNNDTANVTYNQGVFDRMYTELENALRPAYLDEGDSSDLPSLSIFDLEVNTIAEDREIGLKDVATQLERLDKKKQADINKFADLESAIARTKAMSEMLDIQMKVSNRDK